MEKKEVYRRIKIYGLLSYIPFILAAGPLSGYALGSYLEKRFGLPDYVCPISAGLGLAGAAIEIARIIKQVSKIDRNA